MASSRDIQCRRNGSIVVAGDPLLVEHEDAFEPA
jgi:hypothetical protein